jgi:hypothetical protein
VSTPAFRDVDIFPSPSMPCWMHMGKNGRQLWMMRRRNGEVTGMTSVGYNICSVARWRGVATMMRGHRVWWKRESGDDHIGEDDMGDRWWEVRGRG